MSLNERLKEARKKCGITQGKAAEQLGVGNTTISNWESGFSRPDVDMIKKICEVYHVEPNYLFEWDEYSKEHSYYLDIDAEEVAQQMFDRPALKTLFKTSKNVSSEDLLAVQNIIDALAKKQYGGE